MEILDCFSSSYVEAREKYLDAAKKYDAEVESIKHPLTGPNEEPLFTDIAVIGDNNANDILLLGSGTHGVEGFTGSGIQTGLLREGIHTALESSTCIIMIHAINPYGFAHLRRANEDNVDLNRNFFDHSKPIPPNNGYDKLADVISPKTISIWQDIKFWRAIFHFRLKHGKAELEKAVSGDQFSHPEGLFYGGKHETWSNKTIKKFAKRYLSDAKRLIFIDFHTGLGSYGDAEVILNVEPDSLEYKRAVQIWGERVKATVTGESVSVNLEASLKLAFPKMIPQAEVTAVSLEFGTYPAKDVFLALRSENWLHHHGGINNHKSQKIKKKLLHVFYPENDEWKLSIWNICKEIVEQALIYLKSTAPPKID